MAGRSGTAGECAGGEDERCDEQEPLHRPTRAGGRCGAELRLVRLEEPERQRDAALLELLQERRPQPRRRGGRRRSCRPRVTSSISNLNSSCSVTTSDSIPCTSVTEVTRREPSSSRSRWTMPSSARRDLLADRAHRQVVAGHQHHRLDAGERVARAVRSGSSRASRRGPCSSPGACRAPRRRAPRRR